MKQSSFLLFQQLLLLLFCDVMGFSGRRYPFSRYSSPGEALFSQPWGSETSNAKLVFEAVPSGLKNARDLAQSLPAACGLTPGRIIRTSAVTNVPPGSPDCASRKFKTILDLRSIKELRDDDRIIMPGESGRTDDDDDTFSPAATFDGKEWVTHTNDGNSAQRARLLHISLLDESKVRRTAAKRMPRPRRATARAVALMTWSRILRLVSKATPVRFLSGRLEKKSSAVEVRARDIFMGVVNRGGLTLLNECIIDESGPSLAAALRVCADESMQPVAVYCTAGKDRTGLVAALLIAALFDDEDESNLPPLPPPENGYVNASSRDATLDELILADYTKSDAIYNSLSDRAMVAAMERAHLDPKMFLGAPRHVMEETLAIVRERGRAITLASSGERGASTSSTSPSSSPPTEVAAYLDSIGFGAPWRSRLRSALLSSPMS